MLEPDIACHYLSAILGLDVLERLSLVATAYFKNLTVDVIEGVSRYA
jgi:hypothetical protein